MFRFAVTFCILALCAGAAAGQSGEWDIRLTSGALLRDVAPDTLRGDTLVVGVKGRSRSIALADVSSITHIAPDSNKLSRVVKGVVIGSAIGLIVTALASTVTDAQIAGGESPDRGSGFVRYAPAYTLGGGAVGGLAGLMTGPKDSGDVHRFDDAPMSARRGVAAEVLAASGPRVPLLPEAEEMPRRPAGESIGRLPASSSKFFGSMGLGVTFPVGLLNDEKFGVTGSGPSFMGELGYKINSAVAWQTDVVYTINDPDPTRGRRWTMLWIMSGLRAGGNAARKLELYSIEQVGLIHATIPGDLYEVTFLGFHDYYSGPSNTMDGAAIALGAGMCYDAVVSLDVRYHLSLGDYRPRYTSRSIFPQVLILTVGFKF